MSTDEKLLVHLAEHLREMPDHDAPVSLRLPIRGIHDGEELRRAVQEAWRRGYFLRVEEGQGPVFVANVSAAGAAVFAPK